MNGTTFHLFFLMGMWMMSARYGACFGTVVSCTIMHENSGGKLHISYRASTARNIVYPVAIVSPAKKGQSFRKCHEGGKDFRNAR